MFPGGYANPIDPLSIYFNVLPGKIIYIGTLYIHLPSVSSRPRRSAERAKPRYDIVDEYAMAVGFSKNRYPEFPHFLERHLMRLSH
jgi:hypothetical protein